ncbi:MAG: DUF3656 domain-containing U32 family peptidase, partial [Limisphaerales bacterium]
RGINNKELVHGRFGKKRGVYLGEIAQIEGRGVRVALRGPLKAGDGVVFDAGNPEQMEQGGRVYTVNRRGSDAWLGFGPDINLACLHLGDKLWKTSDPELDRRLRQTYAGQGPKFQRSLSMEVGGALGQSLEMTARDELGNESRVKSAMSLTRAETQPLTPERLRAQLGRLGGTPFKLGELRSNLHESVHLPVSELNRLRRLVVDELMALRARPRNWNSNENGNPPRSSPARQKDAPAQSPISRPQFPNLNVLVRSLPQLETAMESEVQTLYCEFEDPGKYRDAVRLFRSSGPGKNREILVAPPRVFKTGEEWILKQVRSCEADGYLVRNYDHLRFFGMDRCIGDYSLNVANRLSADYFKNKFRLERLTPSYDLNYEQLEALLAAAPVDWFEITIHQHIPMFHMEHCVFCAFLSPGTDYTNCGRPCDRHEAQLRDRVGALHPLKADAGCRNTVFNARAQTGADYVPKMLALGARHFRLEFLNESAAQISQTISSYRQLLR